MAEYIDILTFEDLRRDALSSIDDLTDIGPAAEQAISDVTRLVEDYLHRPVIVSKERQGIGKYAWLAVDYDDSGYYAWANVQPVVQVETSGVEISYDSRRFEVESREAQTVTYFAGWKRPEQALADFPTGTGEALDGLSETPEDVPATIRQVATRLAVHFLKEMKKGMVGFQSIDYAVGDNNPVRLEGADAGFVRRELKRLDRYKAAHAMI